MQPTHSELTLPPLLRAHSASAGSDPLDVALDGAARGRFGAGDFVWSPDPANAAAAIVLEPEVPLSQALQMAPLLMVAIADALGAIGPPNLAITFRWPATILANGGEVGAVRLRVPGVSRLSVVPDFLIADFKIALMHRGEASRDPGLAAGVTVLHEEGCGDLDAAGVLEAVARHFLSRIDGWQQDGFGPIRQSWMERTHDRKKAVSVEAGDAVVDGVFCGIDETGAAIIEKSGAKRLVALSKALGIERHGD